MRYRLLICSVFILLLSGLWAAGKEKDTPKAAETRKKLKQKVSVDFDKEPISGVVESLKSQVKGLGIKLDRAGGVTNNFTITFKADNKTLAEVFEGMFKKTDLGYIVVSKEGDAYDGSILIKKSKERGYPAGEEPDDATAKSKDKAGSDKSDKTASKTKPKADAKDKVDDKSANKDKGEDDADKAEKDAARKLNLAKILLDDGKTAKAKERFEDIVAKYPKTKAAEEARELLKKLDN